MDGKQQVVLFVVYIHIYLYMYEYNVNQNAKVNSSTSIKTLACACIKQTPCVYIFFYISRGIEKEKALKHIKPLHYVLDCVCTFAVIFCDCVVFSASAVIFVYA